MDGFSKPIDYSRPVTVRLPSNARVTLKPVTYDELPHYTSDKFPREKKYLRFGVEISGGIDLAGWRNPDLETSKVLETLADVGLTNLYHSWDSPQYNDGQRAFLSSLHEPPEVCMRNAVSSLVAECGAQVCPQKESHTGSTRGMAIR